MKRVAWITALVLGTIAALVLLWQFRQAMVVFLLSLATSAAVRPVIHSLTKRGLKPGLALIFTYLSILVLVGGLFTVIGRSLFNDLEQLTNNLTSGYEQILVDWPASGDQILKTIAGQLPPAEKLFDALSGEEGQAALQGVIGTASGVAGFFSQVVIILILSIYWSADRVHFERLWLSLIPVEQRMRARTAWREIESGVGDYITGEVVQSYLLVLILWLGFDWIGLPQPALLALISALAWFIPWLGAVLAVIPVVINGLSVGAGVAAAAGLLTVITLILMEFYVQPRFFARQRFNSLFLVLVVIMMAQVAGIIGIIIAPVLAVALQIGFQHLVNSRDSRLQTEQVNEEFMQLQASLENIQKRLRVQREEVAPEMVNLLERLDVLMEKTTAYLQSGSLRNPGP